MVGKRKLALLLCAGLLGTSLVACGNSEPAGDASEGKKKVGVIQLVTHPALDEAYKGFKDGLKEKGFEEGKNIEFDFKNAQNETAQAQTISNQFVNDKKDLIFAIATPVALSAYNATKEIPIVITAVTDPVKDQLVKSLESSGNNVTGTSDMVEMNLQLDAALKLVPNVKTMGVIYNSSEGNSIGQVAALEAECAKKGITVKKITVTNVSEIKQNLENGINGCDMLYTPTDNTVASGYDLVGQIALENNIPILGGEDAIITKGGLISNGINYYELGKQAGFKAAEVLNGKKPNEIPVETMKELTITINTDVAKKLGIKIPEDMDKVAKKVTGGVK